VVVTEQVQDTVHGQQFKLGLYGVAVLLGLGRGDLRAQDHVA
jgi:hypothetical protein